MKQKLLVDATANFICQELQPLSVSLANQLSPVCGRPFICDVMRAFKRLLEIAELRDSGCHTTHTYFTDTVIPAKYCSTRAAIEKQLSVVENCAVTTDLWTSQHQQHTYKSLTAHFVDSNFKHHSKCLRTLEFYRIMMLAP